MAESRPNPTMSHFSLLCWFGDSVMSGFSGVHVAPELYPDLPRQYTTLHESRNFLGSLTCRLMSQPLGAWIWWVRFLRKPMELYTLCESKPSLPLLVASVPRRKMEAHKNAVAKLAEDIARFHTTKTPFWIYHGSTNCTRQISLDRSRIVDTINLNHGESKTRQYSLEGR